MPKVMLGDIVVRYRMKYDERWFMFWKNLVTRAILFFTTEWWRDEKTSTVSHAEMVWKQKSDAEFWVIDQEPPRVQLKTRRFKRCKIFRLINKPANFDERFMAYCATHWRKDYHFLRFPLFILWFVFLKWNFLGSVFSRWLEGTKESVCSVFDARFYQDWISAPCSSESAELTSPDDIYDYCSFHPFIFEVVFDQRW